MSSLTDQLGQRLVDDIKVLVTELVTNSCRHAESGTLGVELGIADGVVTIAVHDSGRGFEPPVPKRDLELESGRGLYIVDALSDRWGVDSSAGTRVWAELDLPSEDGR